MNGCNKSLSLSTPNIPVVLMEDVKAKVAAEDGGELKAYGEVTLKKGMTVIWYDWSTKPN